MAEVWCRYRKGLAWRRLSRAPSVCHGLGLLTCEIGMSAKPAPTPTAVVCRVPSLGVGAQGWVPDRPLGAGAPNPVVSNTSLRFTQDGQQPGSTR